jgi:protein ImuB
LLDSPRALAVSALFPEGPPVQFRDRTGPHIVAVCEGPERIETGWWRGPHVQRDYYRVTDQAGRCFWIFRRRGDRQWFLHGWFD